MQRRSVPTASVRSGRSCASSGQPQTVCPSGRFFCGARFMPATGRSEEGWRPTARAGLRSGRCSGVSAGGARRTDGRSRRRAARGEFPDRLPRCRFVEGRRLSGTRLRLGRNTTEPAFPADMPHRFAVCAAPLLSDLYDGKRPFPGGSIPRKGAFRAVWAWR